MHSRSLSDGIIEELVALKVALQAANVQAEQVIKAVNAGDLNREAHFIPLVVRGSIYRLDYYLLCLGRRRGGDVVLLDINPSSSFSNDSEGEMVTVEGCEAVLRLKILNIPALVNDDGAAGSPLLSTC